MAYRVDYCIILSNNGRYLLAVYLPKSRVDPTARDSRPGTKCPAVLFCATRAQLPTLPHRRGAADVVQLWPASRASRAPRPCPAQPPTAERGKPCPTAVPFPIAIWPHFQHHGRTAPHFPPACPRWPAWGGRALPDNSPLQVRKQRRARPWCKLASVRLSPSGRATWGAMCPRPCKPSPASCPTSSAAVPFPIEGASGRSWPAAERRDN